MFYSLFYTTKLTNAQERYSQPASIGLFPACRRAHDRCTRKQFVKTATLLARGDDDCYDSTEPSSDFATTARDLPNYCYYSFAFGRLLGDRKGIRPVKTEWWGVRVVICLEPGADLQMAQLMPLPLTVSCFSKIQIGFTFLVPAYPVVPGKRPLNVCASARACATIRRN